MQIDQSIVESWAAMLKKMIIQETINDLEKMEYGEMLSGDSGLASVWEEICVQVQSEASTYWNTYVLTMDSMLAGTVEMLDKYSRFALWVLTDEGIDFLDEKELTGESIGDLPVFDREIVVMLMNDLLSAAAKFKNSPITEYLNRPYYDDDDSEDVEMGDDELDSQDDDVEDEENISTDDTLLSEFSRLIRGMADPLIFLVTRDQIESFDVASSLVFLRSLVPKNHSEHIWANRGLFTLMISGYDSDPRELFEIPEVCSYLRAIHEKWPFWLFFFNYNNDDSIKLIASCIVSTSKVEAGLISIDPLGLANFLKHSYAAVNYIFDSYGFPESENEAITRGVTRIFEGSRIDRDYGPGAM